MVYKVLVLLVLIVSCDVVNSFVLPTHSGKATSHATATTRTPAHFNIDAGTEKKSYDNTRRTQNDPEASSTRRKLLHAMLVASGSALLPLMPSPAQAAVTTDEISSSVADVFADWSNINIMKPPPDNRDYTVEILDNGLRVIYCSDPSSTEAGCAMDVHVGATSDPNDIPGLAHFNEHMLFLGT